MVQELINEVKQSPIAIIQASVINPLIFHNLVVYKGHLLRAAFKEKKGVENMIHCWVLKSKMQTFSAQVFERHFNSNDRRELLELARNFRVLEFFVEDCFVYRFDKRPNWHVLYEDVFFQTISEEEAKQVGVLYEALFVRFLQQQTITSESVREAIKATVKHN